MNEELRKLIDLVQEDIDYHEISGSDSSLDRLEQLLRLLRESR